RHSDHDCNSRADYVVQRGRGTKSREASKTTRRGPRGRRGMRTTVAAILTVCSLSGMALAAERQSCEIPNYLLFDGNELKHVAQGVTKEHRLTIAVVGTGSSILAGPDGPRSAYPARLEAALRQRLPGTAVKVVTLVRTRLTADDLAQGMSKLLVDEKPDLVI